MSRSPGASRRSGAEVVGVVLVVVGGLVLLRNTGVLVVDWGTIWAVVLVVAGGAILARSLAARGPHEPGSISIPHEDATRLELDLGVGAGTFRVGGGARDLVEVRSGRDDVTTTIDRRDGVARVRIRQRTDWFPFGWDGPYEWDVRLAEDVPTALVVSAGAGDFAIDLSALRIVDGRISAGAAQVRLTLPRPVGEVRLSVSAGAASVITNVPPGVEARFTTSGLMSVDGRNETPGFATARDRVLVAVTGGISSLRIVHPDGG